MRGSKIVCQLTIARNSDAFWRDREKKPQLSPYFKKRNSYKLGFPPLITSSEKDTSYSSLSQLSIFFPLKPTPLTYPLWIIVA